MSATRRRPVTDSERARIEARYREGATIPVIAAELDRPWSTVGRHVKKMGLSRPMGPAPKYAAAPTDRQCQHCEKPLTFSSPYYAANGRGAYCTRECFLEDKRTGAVVTCPECSREHWRPGSHLHKVHCDHYCAAKARRPAASERLKREWREGGPMVTAIMPFFHGSTRRIWKLEWARKNSGRKRREATPGYAATVLKIRKARVENPDMSERALARECKVSRETVRVALGRPL